MSGSPPATRPWFAEFVLLAAIWGSSFLFTRLAVVEFGALPTAVSYTHLTLPTSDLV